MDAVCIAWDTALPSCPVLFFSSSFPLFPPTQPLSSQTSGVCLFLPCAVRLQFSRCCVFALLPAALCAACSSACQGWVPVCFFSRPPVFLPLFCLRVVCSPACFLPFVSPLLVVAGCPCALLPPSPLLCVCTLPRNRSG